jgi:small subunit ribosomal protein S19
MARSLKKGPYIDGKLLKKVEQMEVSGRKKPIKTWARASMIVPEFVGHNFSVHNGKVFVAVFVTENMVGHRFGEFAATRAFRQHGVATDKTVAK